MSAAVHSKIVCCCLNSTRTLSGADLALQVIDALAAAEYGRQPCGHTPLFFEGWAPPLPQLDGASVLVLHLDRGLVFVLDFGFCLSGVSCFELLLYSTPSSFSPIWFLGFGFLRLYGP